MNLEILDFETVVVFGARERSDEFACMCGDTLVNNELITTMIERDEIRYNMN